MTAEIIDFAAILAQRPGALDRMAEAVRPYTALFPWWAERVDKFMTQAFAQEREGKPLDLMLGSPVSESAIDCMLKGFLQGWRAQVRPERLPRGSKKTMATVLRLRFFSDVRLRIDQYLDDPGKVLGEIFGRLPKTERRIEPGQEGPR